MSIVQQIAFLLCVGLASFAQNLTGFAFGLILLGLVALLHLAPLDASANVVSVLVIANALLVLRRGSSHTLPWRLMWPTLSSSLLGVLVGVSLLGWLSAEATSGLRLLLGVTIVLASFLLILQKKNLAQVSSRLNFIGFGAISGLLGGLFSSAGPPMVYHLYRQPLPINAIRHSLVLLFASNALLRLVFVISHGQFNRQALQLSLLALPIVVGITWWQHRHPSTWSPTVVRYVVFVLLLIAGLSLLLPTAVKLFRTLIS
ncbi:sulfite exporter TauE/SafE family protein [Neisseriaceae bacterium TC5R-5]|nr:sulfite exporter TauE/SafE family protein [Neisseriaceae bacterium TC5R-5]